VMCQMPDSMEHASEEPELLTSAVTAEDKVYQDSEVDSCDELAL